MSARGLIVLSVAAVVSFSGVSAQNLRDVAGPAEIPAPEYVGSQYVDSRGCAFIRAGFAGKITWVPRVGRDRKLLCGFVPSVGSGAGSVAGAPIQPAATVTPPVSARSPVSTKARAPVSVALAGDVQAAWSDGRLNPNRGPQTDAGTAQMALLWTNTVPRKLIAIAAGK